MAISSIGKTAYMFDGTDWYPLSGVTNTAANFTWTGTHSFSQSATFSNSLVASRGINNFTSTTERNTKIPSPVDGTIAFVTTSGVTYPQYYSSNEWRMFGSNAAIETRSGSDFVSNIYTMRKDDIGKTILLNAPVASTIQVPLNSSVAIPVGSQIAIVATGTGQISIAGISGSVIINSKFSNKKLSAQYSQAILVKTGTDTWLLMGDLSA